MMPLLEARGLRKRYGDVTVLDDVSLAVGSGERVGIVGESGSGKSTLARVLLRLDDASAGTIIFDGDDVTTSKKLPLFRRRVQLVMQDPASALNPLMTVHELVEEGLIIHELGDAAARKAKVSSVLTEVGLGDAFMQRRPHALSGGQKQRVALARALAVSPDVLVCDEVTSALDVSVQAQIVKLLTALSEMRGLALVFISHDLHLVRFLCPRVVTMQRGRLTA